MISRKNLKNLYSCFVHTSLLSKEGNVLFMFSLEVKNIQLQLMTIAMYS